MIDSHDLNITKMLPELVKRYGHIKMGVIQMGDRLFFEVLENSEYEDRMERMEKEWNNYVDYIVKCVRYKVSPLPFSEWEYQPMYRFEIIGIYKQTGDLIYRSPSNR